MRRRKFRRNGSKKFIIRRHRRINNLLKLALIPLLIATLALIAYILFFSDTFAVKKIHLVTDKLDCASPDDIKNESRLRGENIFLISSAKIEKKLTDRFLCIKSIRLDKQFPDGLQLTILARQPGIVLIIPETEATPSAQEVESTAAAYASSSAYLDFAKIVGSKSFLVDGEGMIYSDKIENISAPKLYIWRSDLELGKRLAEILLANILKIFEKLRGFGISATEAKLLLENTLIINSSPKIIIGLNRNVDNQVASLQLILEKAKIEETEMEFIDLRFEKPVVKYIPKKGEKNGKR